MQLMNNFEIHWRLKRIEMDFFHFLRDVLNVWASVNFMLFLNRWIFSCKSKNYIFRRQGVFAALKTVLKYHFYC